MWSGRRRRTFYFLGLFLCLPGFFMHRLAFKEKGRRKEEKEGQEHLPAICLCFYAACLPHHHARHLFLISSGSRTHAFTHTPQHILSCPFLSAPFACTRLPATMLLPIMSLLSIYIIYHIIYISIYNACFPFCLPLPPPTLPHIYISKTSLISEKRQGLDRNRRTSHTIRQWGWGWAGGRGGDLSHTPFPVPACTLPACCLPSNTTRIKLYITWGWEWILQALPVPAVGRFCLPCLHLCRHGSSTCLLPARHYLYTLSHFLY